MGSPVVVAWQHANAIITSRAVLTLSFSPLRLILFDHLCLVGYEKVLWAMLSPYIYIVDAVDTLLPLDLLTFRTWKVTFCISAESTRIDIAS